MKVCVSALLVVLFGIDSFIGVAWIIRMTWVLYHSPFLFSGLFLAWGVVYLVVFRVWALRIVRI